MGLPLKLALAGGALLLAWVLVDRLSVPAGVEPLPLASPADLSPGTASAAIAGLPSEAPAGRVAAPASAAVPERGASVAVPLASAPRARGGAQLNEEANLGLTTRLSGEQRITLDQRERSILGARVVTGDAGPQTLVLSRDEASGQIEYWQAALRFALKPGVDAEAFLRARPTLRRLFVNPDYVDVAVEPGDLAAAFRALAADPAVTGVRLLPPRPKVVAR